METDPNLLLALLAVRILGGQSVPAGAPTLKGFKEAIRTATERQLLEEAKAGVPSTNKAGKTTMKKIAVLNLTGEGERFLYASAPPEAFAATAAAHLAGLRQSLEVDRQRLRQEVLGALTAKGGAKGGASPAKDIGQLAKTVAGLSARLEKLEAKLQGGADEQVLARIDQAFATLTTRLERSLPTSLPGPSPSTKHEPVAPTHEAPRPPGLAAQPLRATMRAAYDKLSCFREFQDGLVEIPRLYREVQATVPDVTVAALHRELEQLWSTREVQLHVLNEVRSAAEPDKGIRRNDKLYYYVYWPKR
jgi:hypothetical protein